MRLQPKLPANGHRNTADVRARNVLSEWPNGEMVKTKANPDGQTMKTKAKKIDGMKAQAEKLQPKINKNVSEKTVKICIYRRWRRGPRKCTCDKSCCDGFAIATSGFWLLASGIWYLVVAIRNSQFGIWCLVSCGYGYLYLHLAIDSLVGICLICISHCSGVSAEKYLRICTLIANHINHHQFRHH